MGDHARIALRPRCMAICSGCRRPAWGDADGEVSAVAWAKAAEALRCWHDFASAFAHAVRRRNCRTTGEVRQRGQMRATPVHYAIGCTRRLRPPYGATNRAIFTTVPTPSYPR